MMLMNSSGEMTPSPSRSARSIISLSSACVIVSPNSRATRNKSFNVIAPLSSSSNKRNTFRMSSLLSPSDWKQRQQQPTEDTRRREDGQPQDQHRVDHQPRTTECNSNERIPNVRSARIYTLHVMSCCACVRVSYDACCHHVEELIEVNRLLLHVFNHLVHHLVLLLVTKALHRYTHEHSTHKQHIQ